MAYPLYRGANNVNTNNKGNLSPYRQGRSDVPPIQYSHDLNNGQGAKANTLKTSRVLGALEDFFFDEESGVNDSRHNNNYHQDHNEGGFKSRNDYYAGNGARADNPLNNDYEYEGNNYGLQKDFQYKKPQNSINSGGYDYSLKAIDTNDPLLKTSAYSSYNNGGSGFNKSSFLPSTLPQQSNPILKSSQFNYHRVEKKIDGVGLQNNEDIRAYLKTLDFKLNIDQSKAANKKGKFHHLCENVQEEANENVGGFKVNESIRMKHNPLAKGSEKREKYSEKNFLIEKGKENLKSRGKKVEKNGKGVAILDKSSNQKSVGNKSKADRSKSRLKENSKTEKSKIKSKPKAKGDKKKKKRVDSESSRSSSACSNSVEDSSSARGSSSPSENSSNSDSEELTEREIKALKKSLKKITHKMRPLKSRLNDNNSDTSANVLFDNLSAITKNGTNFVLKTPVHYQGGINSPSHLSNKSGALINKNFLLSGLNISSVSSLKSEKNNKENILDDESSYKKTAKNQSQSRRNSTNMNKSKMKGGGDAKNQFLCVNCSKVIPLAHVNSHVEDCLNKKNEEFSDSDKNSFNDDHEDFDSSLNSFNEKIKKILAELFVRAKGAESANSGSRKDEEEILFFKSYAQVIIDASQRAIKEDKDIVSLKKKSKEISEMRERLLNMNVKKKEYIAGLAAKIEETINMKTAFLLKKSYFIDTSNIGLDQTNKSIRVNK